MTSCSDKLYANGLVEFAVADNDASPGHRGPITDVSFVAMTSIVLYTHLFEVPLAGSLLVHSIVAQSFLLVSFLPVSLLCMEPAGRIAENEKKGGGGGVASLAKCRDFRSK